MKLISSTLLSKHSVCGCCFFSDTNGSSSFTKGVTVVCAEFVHSVHISSFVSALVMNNQTQWWIYNYLFVTGYLCITFVNVKMAQLW